LLWEFIETVYLKRYSENPNFKIKPRKSGFFEELLILDLHKENMYTSTKKMAK
jgi:hypothetical protein